MEKMPGFAGREEDMSESSESKKVSFTEGSIFRSLIRFALPVLGALILQSAYGAVDLLVVGHFGDSTSLSAVGTASSFMQVVTFVINSLAMGSTIVIGHHIGEKRPKAAGDTIGTTIFLFLIVGIAFTVILELAANGIAAIMQVPAESYGKAVTYLRICSGGILIIIAYNVISCIFRGMGNANLPFLFVAIACVVNILCDLLLTGLLGLDVVGVAIATVFAQLVSVVISLLIISRQKDLPFSFSRRQLKIHTGELRRILRVGIPLVLQQSLSEISFLAINAIVNSMGLIPSAGYSVSQKLVGFIMLIPSAVMQSTSAFVSQNIGAGQPERARKGWLTAMGTGVTVGVFIFLLGFFGGAQMSSLFSSEAEVVQASALYLKGFSFDCILTCIMFSTSGYFNGCGNSIPTMIQGISAAFLVRLPVALLMASLPNTTLFHIGLVTPISTIYGILFYLACFAYYRRKEKRQIRENP